MATPVRGSTSFDPNLQSGENLVGGLALATQRQISVERFF
jgi:hypothetical protein